MMCRRKSLQRKPLHVPSNTQLFRISRIPKPAANGIEYELWFLSINSHLARWYKSPSRRAVSSHSTLTPGIFAYLSDGCLWVTRYSLPSRCASRTLDLLRYFSWILAISSLRENKFSLSELSPHTTTRFTKLCGKNKDTTTRSKLKNLE